MKNILKISAIVMVAGVFFTISSEYHITIEHRKPETSAATAANVGNLLSYDFHVNGTLDETGSMTNSWSPYFWVNSGARLLLKDGVGQTIQGSLPINDKWRTAYARANPVDTDNGYHPQNIFRLVTRSQWQNYIQSMYVKMTKYNTSSSPNRDGYNGILLFNRYKDSQNLYYTGIRVDGTAVIKKKINGVYYTMIQTKVLPGTYNRGTNPNLIPINQWIGLRSEVVDNPDGTLSLKLYTDVGRTGNWKLVLTVKDDGHSFGGPALSGKGYAGLRTDFADVQFDDYRLTNI